MTEKIMMEQLTAQTLKTAVELNDDLARAFAVRMDADAVEAILGAIRERSDRLDVARCKITDH